MVRRTVASDVPMRAPRAAAELAKNNLPVFIDEFRDPDAGGAQ